MSYMGYYSYRLLIALVVCSLVATVAPPFARGQGCGVYDMSTFRPDGVCGNNEWDLTVGADEREWHYGPAEAYGACDGGYYDCSNYYNDQGYIFGNKQFFDDGPDESQGEDVHWSLD